jgi:hypothetical protein
MGQQKSLAFAGLIETLGFSPPMAGGIQLGYQHLRRRDMSTSLSILTIIMSRLLSMLLDLI